MNADAIIVTSLVLTGGISIAKQAQAGHVDAVRTGVGLTGAGVGLAVIGQFSPQLGAAFAVAMVLGALLRAGPQVINATSAGLFGAHTPQTSPATVPVPNTRTRAA